MAGMAGASMGDMKGIIFRIVSLENRVADLKRDIERGFSVEDAGQLGHRFRFGIFCPECKEQHHVYLYSDSLAEQAGSCKCGTCSGRFKIRLSVEREEREDG